MNLFNQTKGIHELSTPDHILATQQLKTIQDNLDAHIRKLEETCKRAIAQIEALKLET